MQKYQVLEESITYSAGKSQCQLQFIRCTEPYKAYHLYDLKLVINKTNYFDLEKQLLSAVKASFTPGEIRKVIETTTTILDNWCRCNLFTFISFSDCLGSYKLRRLYRKLGFICDSQIETFVAFVNEEGKRIAFNGMLNLLTEDDFRVNELWQLAKNPNHYICV